MFYLTVSQKKNPQLVEIEENFLLIKIEDFSQSGKLSLIDITESLTEKYNLEIVLPTLIDCDESVLIDTSRSCTQ
jgi:hypothetical protein